MAAFQKGDAAAFEALVRRYETRLWNFLRRFVGEPATAEDLLQEVLLRVVRNAAEWEPTAKFSTWVYTIARNLCTDHARRAVHRQVVSLESRRKDDSGPILLEKLAGQGGDGESTASSREMIERLDVALAELPEEQREVFLMRELSDLSFAEIAEAVGASVPTVKSRMRYALLRLREALAEFHDDGRPFAAAQGVES
jgi:RNA polymerase sigma-70 factor (ECF subfamily)